jgi:pantothenate kinase
VTFDGAFERAEVVSPTRPESMAILGAMQDRRPAPWLVAIAGIPGAGKSTIAADVASCVPGAVVIPMDGYHLRRAVLSADQLKRRGAPDTFDHAALRVAVVRLRATGSGSFPTFDHAVKDPVENGVSVTDGTPLVIVEGLYLLLSDWRMTDLFDFTVFLDCKLEVAMDRIAARHLDCGLAATEDEARRRADTNDRRNALIILDDGCRARADFCVPTGV